MESVISKGYRQTDVGPLPTDWDVKKLGDIFTIGHGKSQHLIACDYGAYPILGTGGRMGLTNHFLYDKPSVLIGRKGTLDKPQYIDIPFWTIDTLFFTRFNSNYSPKYVFFVAQTIKWSSYSEASGVPSLTGNIIEKIQIPIPPTLIEQTNIAIALSDMDVLIENTEKLIAKKTDIKQGTMQQLLTGKTRLPGFSGEWEVKRLGELGLTYGGLTGKTKSDFGEGAARYITFMNVMTNVKIDCDTFEQVTVSSTEVQNYAMKGDLFFNGSSETPEEVAMCAVLLNEVDNVYLNSFCFGFRFHNRIESSGLFFAYYFRSKEGRELMKSLAQGSTRYNLSKAAFLKSPIRLPPFPEQTAIAEVLSDMDSEIAALERDLKKYQDMKQGMVQELLTGRTRLPKEVING